MFQLGERSKESKYLLHSEENNYSYSSPNKVFTIPILGLVVKKFVDENNLENILYYTNKKEKSNIDNNISIKDSKEDIEEVDEMNIIQEILTKFMLNYNTLLHKLSDKESPVSSSKNVYSAHTFKYLIYDTVGCFEVLSIIFKSCLQKEIDNNELSEEEISEATQKVNTLIKNIEKVNIYSLKIIELVNNKCGSLDNISFDQLKDVLKELNTENVTLVENVNIVVDEINNMFNKISDTIQDEHESLVKLDETTNELKVTLQVANNSNNCKKIYKKWFNTDSNIYHLLMEDDIFYSLMESVSSKTDKSDTNIINLISF